MRRMLHMVNSPAQMSPNNTLSTKIRSKHLPPLRPDVTFAFVLYTWPIQLIDVSMPGGWDVGFSEPTARDTARAVAARLELRSD